MVDSSIRVRNVYYMLSYAFQILQEGGYKKLAVEEFENIAEMMAAILIKGMNSQIKRGLQMEYIPVTEPLSTPHGKIDIAETIKTMSFQKKQLVCTYDEFSQDSYMNRIIKTTLIRLRKAAISKQRKGEIRKILVLLDKIDELDPSTINWSLRFNQNNRTYRMLIGICYLALNGLLQSSKSGSVMIMDFFDEQ